MTTEQEQDAVAAVTLDQMIDAARREVAMRQRVYPSWVRQDRMSATKADAEINAMRAILMWLERGKAKRDQRPPRAQLGAPADPEQARQTFEDAQRRAGRR